MDTAVSWSGTHLLTLARIGSRRYPRPVLLRPVQSRGRKCNRDLSGRRYDAAVVPVQGARLWLSDTSKLGQPSRQTCPMAGHNGTECAVALDAGLDEDVGANRVNKLKGTKGMSSHEGIMRVSLTWLTSTPLQLTTLQTARLQKAAIVLCAEAE